MSRARRRGVTTYDPTSPLFSAFLIMALSRSPARTPRLRGYGSVAGPLDTESRGLVPDSEPRLSEMSWGLVVCQTTGPPVVESVFRCTGPVAPRSLGVR